MIQNFKKSNIRNFFKDENNLIIATHRILITYKIKENKIKKKKVSPKFVFTNIDSKYGQVFYYRGVSVFNYLLGKRKIFKIKRGFKGIHIFKNNILLHNKFTIYSINKNLDIISENRSFKNITCINHFKDFILVGTESEGVYVLNNKLEILSKIPFKKNVNSLFSDEHNNFIYVSSNAKTNIYSFQNNFFELKRIIDKLDGFFNNRLLNIDVSEQYNELFCSNRTITLVNKDHYKKKIKGQIEIHSIYNSDSIYSFENTINLPRKNNNLIIENSIHTFNNPANFVKYYSLDNYGKKPSNLRELKSQTLNLNEIAPGNYTLTLYAKSHKDQLSTSKVSFNFSVAYYFWETKTFYILSFIVISLIIIFIMCITFLRQRNKLMVKGRIKELEIKSLNLQMSPHFIFNVLNNIQSVMILEGEKLANEYISSFSKLLRDTLTISNTENITIGDEIAYLKSYTDIENKRMNNKIEVLFKVEIEEELLKTLKIPCMLLQPLIENAFLHGFNGKNNNNKLIIHFALENKLLFIKIIDNGIGRAKSLKKPKPKHKSWATQLIKERINLFNKINRKKDFKITTLDLYKDKLDTGTEVIITIPLTYNFELN